MTGFTSWRLPAYASLAAVGVVAGLALGRVEPVALAAPFLLALVAAAAGHEPQVSVRLSLDRDRALEGGWPLKRVEAVLRAVLRAGAWELEAKRDVPARVVVSEYVDVANAFLDGEETGMVNAVLDGLARALRSAEFERAGSRS